MKQLLFVQGGGRDVHDSWDNKLVASLKQALGRGYAIRYPRMPDEDDPDPAAWQKAVAGALRKLSDGVLLVGHSIGAAILMDYLAAGAVERRPAGVFVIAAPFIGDGGWPSEQLRPTREVALELRDGAPLFFYQGRDDETVPFAHSEMFARAFPNATIRRLEGRDHQLNNDLSEVARDILGFGMKLRRSAMNTSVPQVMKAAAFDRFGGPEVLELKRLPVPRPKAREVLIRLDAAGIGVWDPEVRAGEFELGPKRFPKVIGSDGAGTVAALGSGVKRFKVGDRVYAYGEEGGFYAEYVAVSADDVARVPRGLSSREAGALGADGITALRGLDDTLHLKRGETLMIFGASGGIGHIAVQLAKRMGAKVLAVASKADGVALVRRLGADVAIDGHKTDVAKAVRAFAPGGLDAALVLAGGRGLGAALKTMKKGARVAHPNGVEPEPRAPKGVRVRGYDGTPARTAFARLNRLIGNKAFHVELGRVYQLDQAASAHRQVAKHHLGKLAFEMRS